MSSKHRAGSLDSSLSSASTTELEARKAYTSDRLLELEDEEIEDTDNGMPSPNSISVVMDEYVSASFVGRSSYASGDILSAVTQFNEALGIELQTELECLYDTNLGLVSGLVRREVQSRMYDSPVHSGDKNCKKILNQLADTYIKASSESDRHPSKSKWYMQMGAALCVVNEWEKAKQVYKEGINMCRDKKELKAALKNLIKLEQITSIADIPEEDRCDPKPPRPPSPALSSRSQPAPRGSGSPKLSRRKSLGKMLRRRSKSMSNEKNKSAKTTFDSVDSTVISPLKDFQRSISADVSIVPPPGVRSGNMRLTRVASSDVPRREGTKELVERKTSDPLSSSMSPLAMSDGMVTLRGRTDKRIINVRKRNSIAHLFGRHNTPTISSADKQLWTECFSTQGCAVASYQSMTTSAVAHMRMLSVEPIKRMNRPSWSGGSDDQRDGSEEVTTPRRMTYEATPIKSLKIDSDDSELDDD